MQFNDNRKVTFRRTADGYLVAEAPVARTGIQVYSKKELGLIGDGTVRVYRPEEEVFSKASLATYAHRPVTLGHPGMVTADNWKQHAVGHTSGEVIRDGETVAIAMMVMDAAAIAQVEAKMTRELSMGYEADVVFGDGVTPDGEPYDATQTGLRMNHLAIVAEARGGPDLKIGDAKGAQDMAEAIKTRTIVVDGLPIECTEVSATVIEKLQKQLTDSAVAADTAQATADAELAARDARITELEAAVVSDAQLDERVTARATLIADANTVAGDKLETSGMDSAAIRKAAVAAKLGDAKVEGKSDTYVEAMFDHMLATADATGSDDDKQDQFATVVKDGKTQHNGNGAWSKKVFDSAGVKMKGV